MPQITRLVDSKFYNLTTNGNDFNLNTSSFSNHLRANVMDVIRAEIKVRVSWYDADDEYDGEYAEYDTRVNGILKRIGANFITEGGFSVGDEITIRNENFGDIDRVFTITSLTEDEIYVNPDNVEVLSPPGGNPKQVVAGTSLLQALIFSYGIIPQSENSDYSSLVTEEDQVFYVDGIGSVPTPLGDPKPNKSWQNGKLFVSDRSVTNEPNLFANVTGKNDNQLAQEITIVHDFIVPYYNIDWLENIQNGSYPDLFNNEETLKYVFKTEFRRELANPNTSKTGEFNDLLGSVGWFNENFNGYNKDYYISSIEITDSLSSIIDNINLIETNHVKIVLDTNDNIRVRALFSSLPEEDIYLDTNYNLQENLVYSNAGTVANPEYDGAISNVTLNVNGSQTEVEFDISFSSQQLERLSEGGDYLIALSVESDTVENRVTLIAKAGQFVEASADVPDLSFVEDVNYYNVGDFESAVGGVLMNGASNFSGFVEDSGILEFTIKQDVTKNASLNDFFVNLVAYNSATGDLFTIEELELDITDQTNTSGYQNIFLDSSRNYNLPDNSVFNDLLIETLGLTGDFILYRVRVGFKIDWQTWEPLFVANEIFLDRAKLNNGLNNNAANYANSNGYNVHFAIDRNVSNGESTTFYRDLSAALELNDYDTSPDDYSCEIRTETQTGEDLEGLILSDQPTVIKAIFSNVTPIDTLTDKYVIIRLEQQNATDFQISEASSLATQVSSNLFSDDNIALSLESDQIVATITVDNNNIQSDALYRVSSRVGQYSPIVNLGDITLNTVSIIDGPSVNSDINLSFDVTPDPSFRYFLVTNGTSNSVNSKAGVVGTMDISSTYGAYIFEGETVAIGIQGYDDFSTPNSQSIGTNFNVPALAPLVVNSVVAVTSQDDIILNWDITDNNLYDFYIFRSLDGAYYFAGNVSGDSSFIDVGVNASSGSWYNGDVVGETYKIIGVRAGVAYSNSNIPIQEADSFEFTVNTANLGSSNSNQYRLPLINSGSYSCLVNWGDGNINNINSYNQSETLHTYVNPGTYTIKVYGQIEGFRANEYGDELKLIDVSKWGDLVISTGNSFLGCANLVCTAIDEPNLTTDSLTEMFEDCENFNGPIGNMDTTGVTQMNDTFNDCTNFNQPINFDFALVTSMERLFFDCTNFNQPLNVNAPLCTSFDNLLSRCSNFNSAITIDASTALDLSDLFGTCVTLNSLVTINNSSNATSMAAMFNGCTVFNQPLTLDTSSVQDFRLMFRLCEAFNQVINFNTNSATNMAQMFDGCTLFNQTINFNTSSVTTMNSMFRGCQAFNSSLTLTDTSNVESMRSMFQGCTNFNQTINFNIPNVTDLVDFLNGCSSFASPITLTNTSGVLDMSNAFKSASLFNHNISSWDVSNVANMGSMFSGCTVFNQPLNTWVPSSCTSFNATFRDCTAFNQDLDMWNTGAATNMALMFFSCTLFNGNVTTWNTANVTDFSFMFVNCVNFNQDLSGWDFSSVTTMGAFLQGSTLSTVNYDALLIRLASFISTWTTNGITPFGFHGGNSQYTLGGAAETARNDLLAFGITINDGGGI